MRVFPTCLLKRLFASACRCSISAMFELYQRFVKSFVMFEVLCSSTDARHHVNFCTLTSSLFSLRDQLASKRNSLGARAQTSQNCDMSHLSYVAPHKHLASAEDSALPPGDSNRMRNLHRSETPFNSSGSCPDPQLLLCSCLSSTAGPTLCGSLIEANFVVASIPITQRFSSTLDQNSGGAF